MIEAAIYLERDDFEGEVIVEGEFIKGDKGCHTQRNGDPGWPGTPDEIEITALRFRDGRECPFELDEKETKYAEKMLWQVIDDEDDPRIAAAEIMGDFDR